MMPEKKWINKKEVKNLEVIFGMLILIIVGFTWGYLINYNIEFPSSQVFYNSSLPCNEAGDVYFVVGESPYTTTYACEHNGQRRLLVHNSYLEKINLTVDKLPSNLHYLMDNKTKYIYNINDGVADLGILDYDESRLFVEVTLDERYPYQVLRKFCPNGVIDITKSRDNIVYSLECKLK